jgi:NTP pyrophosphatase (non-canonical NTP hydrolase)
MTWVGDLTIREVLETLRKVTLKHFEKSGRKWTVYEQLNHTHSEVSELYETLRGKHRDPNVENIVEEIWDIVFSALTNSHVLDISDERLLDGLGRTFEKIKGRVSLS